jgi:hypothetical protein
MTSGNTAASEATYAGDSAEEVSWLLGHKDSTVTRRVYVTEIQSVERSAKRQEKMEARMGGTLSSLGSGDGGAGPNPKRHARLLKSAEVVELSGSRTRAAKDESASPFMVRKGSRVRVSFRAY